MFFDRFSPSCFFLLIVLVFFALTTTRINCFSLATNNMVSFPTIFIGRRLFTTRTFAKPVTARIVRLYSSGNDNDSVVSRCTQKISSLLNPLKILVTSSNEDPNGSHIRIECVSEEFTGKSAVQRQRLIYKAIWDELNGGPVHAVDSIIAKSPKEVGL